MITDSGITDVHTQITDEHNQVIDVHTHRPGVKGSICSGGPREVEGWLERYEEGWFSVGIHPWITGDIDSERVEEELGKMMRDVRRTAGDERVVAIGECGLDGLRGGSQELQRRVLMEHIRLSEELEKPLILHVVRRGEEVLGMRREYRRLYGVEVKQAWIWHGFRGGVRQGERVLREKGMYLSFGARWNSETVRWVPVDRMFAESDDWEGGVDEVVSRLARERGESPMVLRKRLITNGELFFPRKKSIFV